MSGRIRLLGADVLVADSWTTFAQWRQNCIETDRFERLQAKRAGGMYGLRQRQIISYDESPIRYFRSGPTTWTRRAQNRHLSNSPEATDLPSGKLRA